MYAVIFEVKVREEGREAYLAIAAELRQQLSSMEGFLSIERFQSLVEEQKLLSLSYWESEAAILNWKNRADHKQAQAKGRAALFEDYHITIARVERAYSMATSEFDQKQAS